MVGISSTITLVSCETIQENNNTSEAFDRFKKNKIAQKDSDSIINKKDKKVALALVVVNPKLLTPAIKNTKQDKWLEFNTTMKAKIRSNENKINKIKNGDNTNIKTSRKVKHIEEDNNILQEKINKSNEELIANRDNFKLKMNTDATKIDVALNKLISKN